MAEKVEKVAPKEETVVATDKNRQPKSKRSVQHQMLAVARQQSKKPVQMFDVVDKKMQVPGATHVQIAMTTWIASITGMHGLQMVENIGRAFSCKAVHSLKFQSKDKHVLILISGHNNSTMVAYSTARHLVRMGTNVSLCILTPQPERALKAVLSPTKLISVQELAGINDSEFGRPSLILDCMDVRSSQIQPQSETSSAFPKTELTAIKWANKSNIRTISFEYPAGLGAFGSGGGDPYMESNEIFCSVLPRNDLIRPEISAEFWLCDSGLYPLCYEKIGLKMDSELFGTRWGVQIKKPLTKEEKKAALQKIEDNKINFVPIYGTFLLLFLTVGFILWRLYKQDWNFLIAHKMDSEGNILPGRHSSYEF